MKHFSDSTLKDVDFIRFVDDDVLSMNISEKDITQIVNTLNRDIKFLLENKLMDYSLLLGIEKINTNITDSPQTKRSNPYSREETRVDNRSQSLHLDQSSYIAHAGNLHNQLLNISRSNHPVKGRVNQSITQKQITPHQTENENDADDD